MRMRLFPNLKIAHKLRLALVGSALLVSAGVGMASYFVGSATVDEMSRRQLRTIADERAHEFSTYLDSIQTDFINTAVTESLATTLRDVAVGWGNFAASKPPVDAAATLRGVFIDANPNPRGERHLLESPEALAKVYYGGQHTKAHPVFRRQVDARGYADLYLIDPEGNVIYSVMKRDDFATSLAESGPYADSGLGRAFREALTFTEPGQIAFQDLSMYAPAGEPAAFLATALFDARQRVIGVMAVQMPNAPLTSMMQKQANLGKTGESFFVGMDHLLRNDSLFSEENDTLRTSFKNPVVDAALAGEVAEGVTTDYRGMRMLATAQTGLWLPPSARRKPTPPSSACAT
jgi:hypothetical protein